MDVLVVESQPEAASIAILQLEARGHQVHRCHDPETEAFPCLGLSTGHCPIEHEAIDVVLTVRGQSHAQPTPLEDGVTCALRRRVPVVVAGQTSPNPFEQYGATTAQFDVVGACERAAEGEQRNHEVVAVLVLNSTLKQRGLPTGAASARVVRSGSGLRVTLFVPSETPKAVRDIAVVRVAGELRAFDRHAARIEMSCKTSA